MPATGGATCASRCVSLMPLPSWSIWAVGSSSRSARTPFCNAISASAWLPQASRGASFLRCEEKTMVRSGSSRPHCARSCSSISQTCRPISPSRHAESACPTIPGNGSATGTREPAKACARSSGGGYTPCWAGVSRCRCSLGEHARSLRPAMARGPQGRRCHRLSRRGLRRDGPGRRA